MYKMERLNVIRYVATETERDKLKSEGFKEATTPKRGGKNGAGKTDGGAKEA